LGEDIFRLTLPVPAILDSAVSLVRASLSIATGAQILNLAVVLARAVGQGSGSTRSLSGVRFASTWEIQRVPCLQFVYNKSMAAETTTVRVRRPDSERLQSLAKARQTAVIDVVHAAIDALERQEFLRGLNGDYQRLRGDPELWEQYLAERREWDALA